ncbi:hypothetical protein [Bradyrhizobium japonicum]|uniref:hypothetical protein n=1 Tax=Bradyrhizobium japonicum TaxID=375 RepID=UPI000675EFBB|nr:hypothetical protein [Bradyrhizobium japonicum]
MKIAKPDWTVAQVRDLAAVFDRFYIEGIMAAAEKARSWGNEAGGGSGQGGEGYISLADAITRLINDRR